jgi:parallel beta-helix repeat protein
MHKNNAIKKGLVIGIILIMVLVVFTGMVGNVGGENISSNGSTSSQPEVIITWSLSGYGMKDKEEYWQTSSGYYEYTYRKKIMEYSWQGTAKGYIDYTNNIKYIFIEHLDTSFHFQSTLTGYGEYYCYKHGSHWGKLESIKIMKLNYESPIEGYRFNTWNDPDGIPVIHLGLKSLIKRYADGFNVNSIDHSWGESCRPYSGPYLWDSVQTQEYDTGFSFNHEWNDLLEPNIIKADDESGQTYTVHMEIVGGVWQLDLSVPVTFTWDIEVKAKTDGPVYNVEKKKYYDEIQEAVNDANPGNTIEVSPGTYEENVDVTKPLKIKSTEGAESTIVKAVSQGQPVFKIKGDETHIEGFTIKSGYYGVSIEGNNVNTVTIESCIITENVISGIFVHNIGLKVKCHNCKIYDNFGAGIYATEGDIELAHVEIYKNIGFGVCTRHGNIEIRGEGSQIYENHKGTSFEELGTGIEANKKVKIHPGAMTGVYNNDGAGIIGHPVEIPPGFEISGNGGYGIYSADKTTFKNILIENNGAGIFLREGILTIYGTNNIIRNNRGDGIHIEGWGYKDAEVSIQGKCEISDNNGWGIFTMGAGIEILDGAMDKISKNGLGTENVGGIRVTGSVNFPEGFEITYNDGPGIRTGGNTKLERLKISNNVGHGIWSDGKDLIVENCEIQNNVHYGIFGTYKKENKENIAIMENSITQNDIGGIYLYSSYLSSIYQNTISDNGPYGIYLHSSDENTISKNEISQHNLFAIKLYESHDNNINENSFILNGEGISDDPSNDNTISNNIFIDNDIGIRLEGDDNIISGNTFSGNDYGIILEETSDNNQIYCNNFIDNTVQAEDHGDNIWDDGAGTGNFWSDYTGIDKNKDGIGDTLHLGLDNCPLIIPVGLEDEVTDLIPLIEDMELHDGIENSLGSKVKNALKSIDKINYKAAANQLNAFINEVEAQRGKKITTEQADILIAAVEEIVYWLE